MTLFPGGGPGSIPGANQRDADTYGEDPVELIVPLLMPSIIFSVGVLQG